MDTLPRETLQEILNRIPAEYQSTPRLTCRLFAEMIPQTPEYQRHLGLINDDPKLISQAISRKPKLADDICRNASSQGSLEVIQWARANGCPWDAWTCAYAAKNGHLEVLQWATANGCPWDAWTCAYAAENGHLGVLQWARANDCPWDSWTYTRAAENNHLHIIQYIHQNGCPWDSQECLRLSKNHPRVQEWIRQNM